jgi:hypothetical protein
VIRALAIVLLLAGFIAKPSGWREDVDAANALAAKANAMPHFGGAPAVATTQVHLPPDGPGALYVTAIAGKVSENLDAAARVAVDAFLGAPKRAQLTSATISIDRTASRVDAARKQIEATLEWHETGASTTHARLVIAADGTNLIAVTGECLFGTDTTPAAREACDQALATLDPGIAADKRVALSLAPEGSEPPPASANTGSNTGSSSGSSSAPTMSDGSRTPMPPITLPHEPERTVDRRPVYVGAGIVVLAGLFWWNRRRREAAEAVKKETDE